IALALMFDPAIQFGQYVGDPLPNLASDIVTQRCDSCATPNHDIGERATPAARMQPRPGITEKRPLVSRVAQYLQEKRGDTILLFALPTLEHGDAFAKQRIAPIRIDIGPLNKGLGADIFHRRATSEAPLKQSPIPRPELRKQEFVESDEGMCFEERLQDITKIVGREIDGLQPGPNPRADLAHRRRTIRSGAADPNDGMQPEIARRLLFPEVGAQQQLTADGNQ